MSDITVINALEQMKAFLNEKGVMEIALRNRDGKIRSIQKVMISSLSESQQELTQNVIHILNKNTLLNERNLNLLGNVAKLEKIGLLFNGLNLCASCAGFAVMFAKLDAMSSEINQKLNQLQKTVTQTQDIRNDYEFNKVLAEHTDMLDSERRQQPYSEEKMRKLVDREYNVLMLLISSLQKNVSGDEKSLIFSIFSMLSMFTVSLRTFDELYYFNNRQALGEKEAWHLAHDKWMSVYDTFSSAWFIEKLQDYGMFEANLSTLNVDIYYISLLDQAADLRREIEDNQILIMAMGDMEHFRQYKEMTSWEVADTIESAFREAGGDLDEETVRTAYHETMQLAAIA